MKRILSFALTLIMVIFCWSMPCLAIEQKKVKVGYYDFPYFQEIDSNGNYYGYSYDYLQAISQYTGWEYEYVTYATSSQCLEMLKKGEIDLMGVVQKTPEREMLFDYPDIASGTSMTYLVTDKDSTKYAFEDFEAFNNMTLALQKDSARNNGLVEYCEKNNFSVNTITYDTKEEFADAISTGKVDAGLISSNQVNPSYRIIAKFDTDKVYYVTTKGNVEVLKGLNYAISQIKMEKPDFDSVLYEKHYSFSSFQIPVLSKAEQNYVQENPKLRVLYHANRPPFEVKNEDGQACGISIEIMEEISKAVGIDFEYISVNNGDERQQLIESKEYDLVSLITYDYNWANHNGVFITQPYVNVDYVAIYRQSGEGDLCMALPKGYYVSDMMKPLVSQFGEIRYYDTMLECIEAVYSGEADYTFTNIYESEYFLSQPKYRVLKFRGLQLNAQQFSIGVMKNSDPILYSILAKGLKSISGQRLADIIQSHVNHSESSSFFDMVYTNPLQFLFITGSIATLVLSSAFLLTLYRINKKKRQLLETAISVKSDFLSSMSHDMRTPMNAIIGMSHLGLESSDLDESKQYLMQINKSGKYLLNLINDTLDMNKIEQNKMVLNLEPYYSADFINTITSLLKKKAEDKGVNFVVEVPFNTGRAVLLDKLRLQQIFINLLNNAIKFTPPGGNVKFIIEVTDTHKEIIDIKFTVWDDGIGMSEEFQKKMFEPFEQELRSIEMVDSGTGLGLSIVYKLVHLMNGEITCNSKKEKGTEFVIKLQAKAVVDYETVHIQENSKSEIDAILLNKRVLLVEDHPLNTQISTKLLQRKGICVVHAENGKVAVQLFKESIDYFFDAILMDIRMPVMDGLEATREIRKLNKPDANTIPIIAMTANAFDDDVRQSMDAGMNAHLGKPIEPQLLYDTLSQWIGKK